MKKSALILIVVVVGGIVVLFSFDSRILNVIAQIDNILSIEPSEVSFGTVFPQEYINKQLTINLDPSFSGDVEYKIVQQLKPCPLDNPQCGPGGYYPNLCPFLSKTDADPEDQNDTQVPSYFINGACQTSSIEYATGKLTNEDDVSDLWLVDLKVPPILGFVGQDWPISCIPWVIPENGKLYGCDLSVEVTAQEEDCFDQADVMLVLDRSGSIDATELATLKTAAHAFVTALNPKTDGVHMGQTSFSTTGTLDLHLTDNATSINAAIDVLTSGGYTNLYEGIKFARDEFDDFHIHERPSVPDIMVVITDGNTNRPTPDSTARAMAATEADVSRSAGIEIFVVGVGSDVDANYLRTEIADDINHYFPASNFDDLEAILNAIANCEPPPPPPQPEILFSDNFETDLSLWTKSYEGLPDSSNLNDDVYRTDSLTPGDYYVVIKDDAAITASINTTGKKDIEVSYIRRTSGAESIDTLRARWRIGNSGSWTQLEGIITNTWETKTWVLPVGANNQSQIQLQFFMDDGNGDLGLVDDVRVIGTPI